MKGIVFTEFLEMVEDQFSLELADQIIEDSKLKSGAAYTSVGTYDYEELLKLVTALSAHTDIPINDLVRSFGTHLLGKFFQLYPQYFNSTKNSFEFLDSIENKIHVNVKKLYPDAELPTFDAKFPNSNEMELTYQSNRPFASLAHGLIEGVIHHYQEDITVEIIPLEKGSNTNVIFKLRKIKI